MVGLTGLGIVLALLGLMFLATFLLGAGNGALALGLVFFALSYLAFTGGGYPPPRR